MTEIWICEDDQNLTALIKIYLINIGFSVSNILQSIPTQEGTCDILIIDYELCKTDPIRIIHEVKAFNENVFIIVLAKSLPYDLGHNSLNVTINKLLMKPINLVDIEKEVINSFFDRKISAVNPVMDETFLNYIITEINNEFRFINTLLKENNIHRGYFDLFVFSKSNKQFDNVKICESLEDFFEILLLISSSTYELILDKINDILMKFKLLFSSDKQFITRIENLKKYLKAFSHFVNLKMYDALQVCFEMEKYYSSHNNTKMIIRTKSMITTCYSYIGFFDKSIQKFNELYSMNFLNLEAKLLFKRLLNIILKRHFKLLILLDERKEYLKILNEFALVNESFLENNIYFDSVYTSSKLNYITYYGKLQNGDLLANHIFNEVIQYPISVKNRLIFDILLDYYFFKGSFKKIKDIFDQYTVFYNYYKKEYYLINLNKYYVHFLLFNGDINKASAIFKSYQKILLNPDSNCIIYQGLFVRYVHFSLLTGDFALFNNLFKILLANYEASGIKGPKLFLLLETKIHYSIVFNEIYYPIIPIEIISQDELNFNNNSFYAISNKYLTLVANINEKGINKVFFEQMMSLFYFSIDNSQYYLAKTIYVTCFELVINEFINSNYFSNYLIEITIAYESNVDVLKIFPLYYEYIRCLYLITQNLTTQGDYNQEIESILNYFIMKRIKFFSRNIINYKSKMLNLTNSQMKEVDVDKKNVDNQSGYSILTQTITSLFKKSTKIQLSITEMAILLILFNYKNMTRNRIATELGQNSSSIRYNINKLQKDGLIDFDINKKSDSEIRKSSHKYYLTKKGTDYMKEVFNDINFNSH